jgi:hypothetical protein
MGRERPLVHKYRQTEITFLYRKEKKYAATGMA